MLAPNEHYQSVGPQVAEQDVRVCEQIAETGQISVDVRSSLEAKNVWKDASTRLRRPIFCRTERRSRNELPSGADQSVFSAGG
jgi:hypothetical protein